MLYFLLLVTILISLIWAFSTQILSKVMPKEETTQLVGLYLKILIISALGYAAFKSRKHYVQA
jgi:MATE family multidrug resistance protein